MALIFQEPIRNLGGEPEKGLTRRERPREAELPRGAGRHWDSPQPEGNGSLGIGHTWVEEQVRWGDASRESWASPMESIPKTSRGAHVHFVVFLTQIYHHFGSWAAGTQPAVQPPGDGASTQQMLTGLHVTITAPSRAPRGQRGTPAPTAGGEWLPPPFSYPLSTQQRSLQHPGQLFLRSARKRLKPPHLVAVSGRGIKKKKS